MDKNLKTTISMNTCNFGQAAAPQESYAETPDDANQSVNTGLLPSSFRNLIAFQKEGDANMETYFLQSAQEVESEEVHGAFVAPQNDLERSESDEADEPLAEPEEAAEIDDHPAEGGGEGVDADSMEEASESEGESEGGELAEHQDSSASANSDEADDSTAEVDASAEEAPAPRLDNSLNMAGTGATTLGVLIESRAEFLQIPLMRDHEQVVELAKEGASADVLVQIQERGADEVLNELLTAANRFQVCMNQSGHLTSFNEAALRIIRARLWKNIKIAYQRKHGRDGNFNEWFSSTQQGLSWRSLHNDLRVAKAKDAEGYAFLGMGRLLNIVIAILRGDGGKDRIKEETPIKNFLRERGVSPIGGGSNTKVPKLKQDVDAAINAQELLNANITTIAAPKIKAFTTKHGLLKNVHLSHLKKYADEEEQLRAAFEALVSSNDGIPKRQHRTPDQINLGRFTKFIEDVDLALDKPEKREGITTEAIQEVIEKLQELQQHLSDENDE
ncbi:hypothetical protein SAMN02745216_02975 [Desulfatibacillum alkenivorans DSM 16219]|jgi:hypothetical protein|uniref:Uncharacterized protein n=1 Tax=Desulfatibacillum alkenivorans DSM 16219 TaxID=1121393 RepID=A0A1M6Q6P6_9BACT|nr:hypothetical protein [Desulfatibacillum alkenivorans]SHK15776.1 hypothetical protein SAMN02745216_02975 [Desulfatibacillum alkenivorans DSM 16219]